MAEPAKYLFDRNLAPGAAVQEPPEVRIERQLRQEFERELAAVRQSEYERGQKDGMTAALESLEAKMDEAVGQLVDSTAQITASLDKECSAIRSEAIMVALAASERLASDLIRNEPIKLLESLFSQCLEHLGDAPHIAIRVSDEFAERLQEKVTAIAERRGFAGKIIVLGDPETQSGDCRIEWADGGISRDFESLRANVAAVIKRHLATRRNGAAEPETPAEPEKREIPVMPPVVLDPPTGSEMPQPNDTGEIS